MLRMVPLPRFAGAEKRNRSRDASAPEFCCTTPRRVSPPKGGEAPKGAIQPLAAQHQQALPLIDARARLRATFGARPPSAASPRHSPGRTHPALAQPQNRVSQRLELAGVLPAYVLAVVKRAPRRPVLVPVDRCPSAARERIAFIRARGPHSLRLPKVPSRKAPLVSEIRDLCSLNRDESQALSHEKRRAIKWRQNEDRIQTVLLS